MATRSRVTSNRANWARRAQAASIAGSTVATVSAAATLDDAVVTINDGLDGYAVSIADIEDRLTSGGL